MAKTYTIRKGKHRARPVRFGIYFNRKTFKWCVKFDESARYLLPNHQQDINKLCGIRYLFGDYSARFGWRYVQGKIELLAYVHDNGHVTKSDDEKIICRIDLNKEYDLNLKVGKNEYQFEVTGADQFEAYASVHKSHNNIISFRQGPYFGGQSVAPCDIRIKLNLL